MSLAILSDIHANAPALRAVLRDIDRQGVKTIWHLGDVVGYAPFPNEVIAELLRRQALGILGNYDQKVLEFKRKQKTWQQQKDPAKYFSFAWTSQNLSSRSRQYLKKLPETLSLEFGGKKFLLVHGSPQRNDEALTDTTPDDRFKELAAMTPADVILCGHSHRPFSKKTGTKEFINPGSVGRPFDGDPRAAYATVDLRDGQWVVVHHRVAYPVEENLQKMQEENFPEPLMLSLARGRSVDDLKENPAPADRDVMAEVLALAEKCRYERDHAHQVTALALQLFDQLREWHQLGDQERLWLQAAGLLHDIGWIKGRQGHHKTGRDIILAATELPFSDQARVVIALLVRYHRRSAPQDSHRYYSELTPELKTTVRRLAGLLRIADGLDRRHGSVIRELQCRLSADCLEIRVVSDEPCAEEIEAAQGKTDLFSQEWGKTVIFAEL